MNTQLKSITKWILANGKKKNDLLFLFISIKLTEEHNGELNAPVAVRPPPARFKISGCKKSKQHLYTVTNFHWLNTLPCEDFFFKVSQSQSFRTFVKRKVNA
jgi:hypothetical protein